MQDKLVLVFRKEEFQLPAPFQCGEMMWNAIGISWSAEWIQHDKVSNKGLYSLSSKTSAKSREV